MRHNRGSRRVSRTLYQAAAAATLSLVLVPLAGCNADAARTNAETLAERYFQAAALDDPSPVFALYDASFYKATPQEQWRSAYTALRTKLGKPTEHTLTNWLARSNVGTGGTGFFVTLVYDVKYERANGSETFAIFIPAGTARAGISGHHFESDALLK